MQSGSLSRRSFLRRAAVIGLASQLPGALRSAEPSAPVGFADDWARTPDRNWIGPSFWANPLQDWEVRGGRLVCNRVGINRNVHLLTHDLSDRDGEFAMTVQLGRHGGGPLGRSTGSAGFRLGVRGSIPDFRHSLICDRGYDAGLAAGARLFLGQHENGLDLQIDDSCRAVTLRLRGVTRAGQCSLTLEACSPSGLRLGQVDAQIEARHLLGNISLVSNYGAGAPPKRSIPPVADGEAAGDCFSFSDWRLSGSLVNAHPDRSFGPILFSHYSLSRGVMKLTAQLPPLGPADSDIVDLELCEGTTWKRVASAPVHPSARTAAFRIEQWDATRDHSYRLVYRLRYTDGAVLRHEWSGTVRRDPVERTEFTLADISCNTHEAFPNPELVGHVSALDPDLLAFVGDQFYETSGGYGIERAPLDRAIIDYLRKWFLHGWTWRELTRDRPSLSLPDDHDVYQGNLWGEGGHDTHGSIEAGGFAMPATWVEVVYQSQTAHHPDPHDSRPGTNGIRHWYGSLHYAGIDFAVLADRQYKSGPEGRVPPTGNPRADHVTDPGFDPATADVPGLELLGAEQEAFLDAWSRNWHDAAMKVVISQTVFTAMPTTHGNAREILRADYDANGWPQTPRQRAVRAIRRASAFHVAGDQHLPALVQYGIERHGDGPVAFAGPAVNVGYTRWWEPEIAPWTKGNGSGLTGDFTDSFGHPLTVLAVANGRTRPSSGDVMQSLADKASGLGVVRFDKERMQVTVECWPFRADPTAAGTQCPGWPMSIDLVTHLQRGATGFLPRLVISGSDRPVVEVCESTSGEMLYGIRLPAHLADGLFAPPVFAAGTYTVRVLDTTTGRSRTIGGLVAAPRPDGDCPVYM